MIKFRGERDRYKVARTKVPRTAEFKPYNDADADSAKSDLMDAAAAALGRIVDAHPELGERGFRPDDLYKTVMEDRGLREAWERAFGGEDRGRDLFGLVAWAHFFDHDATWLATPPKTPGLGKRGWTYLAESAATDFAPRSGLRAIGFVINQCVLWRLMQRHGRIISEPRQREDTLIPEREYKVRFPRGPLGDPDERWLGERSLFMADDGNCRDIDPDPVR
jgi:hypothetical protein